MSSVDHPAPDLSEIAESLDNLVDEVHRGGSERRVFVAVATSGFRRYAVSGNYEQAANASETTLPLGCCAKLLLSALTERAVSEGRFDLTSPLRHIVGSSLKGTLRSFLDITIGQLLNHTHGLPKSGTMPPTFLSSGRLDSETLARRISSCDRISEPGEIYSYGHEGAWICAVVLEEIWGNSFFSLLGSKLFPYSSVRKSEGSVGVCPAGVGGLTLDADTFVAFLLDQAIRFTMDSSCFVQMPGWTALTSGCIRGWLLYEESWIGHDSTIPNFPMLVRVNPKHQIAAVVMSQAVHPVAVASRIFSSALPDIVKLRVPQLLPRDAGSKGVVQAYCGTYANGSIRVEVVAVGTGIRLKFPGEAIPPRGDLIAAEQHVFLNPGAATRLGAVLQFLSLNDGRFKFLWTGRYVLAREQPARC